MDALSRIPWDQSIRAEACQGHLHHCHEVPDALMEIYTCHEKAISSLILESPPVWMTVTDWVQVQKADTTINHVVTQMESKKLESVKVDEEMSYELKQNLRQRGMLCCEKEFCIGIFIKLDGITTNCNW